MSISFSSLSRSQKRAVLKKIRSLKSLDIAIDGQSIFFDTQLITVGYKCSNNTCNAVRQTNIHPNSLPFVVDTIPCFKCHQLSYLSFIGDDEGSIINSLLKPDRSTLDSYIEEWSSLED